MEHGPSINVLYIGRRQRTSRAHLVFQRHLRQERLDPQAGEPLPRRTIASSQRNHGCENHVHAPHGPNHATLAPAIRCLHSRMGEDDEGDATPPLITFPSTLAPLPLAPALPLVTVLGTCETHTHPPLSQLLFFLSREQARGVMPIGNTPSTGTCSELRKVSWGRGQFDDLTTAHTEAFSLSTEWGFAWR